MVEYICQKCNKKFNRKSTYDEHLLRKNPCDILYPESIKCSFCNIIIKNKRSLNQHLKSCKPYKISINGDGNLINSNNNTINSNNNITNNFNINIYGKENLDYLTEEVWRDIFKSGYSSLIKLVELTNFNEDHPENMNLHFINLNNKHSIFYKAKDNLWICVPFEEFMTDKYFMEKKDILEDKAEEMGIKSKRLKEVADRIDKGSDSYWVKLMLEKVQHLLYTWTDKVKENKANEEKRKKNT